MNERRWNILGWSVLLLGLFPLLCFRAFWIDWFNHVWMTNHYAHVFATTADFPSMLSAAFDDAPANPYVETGWPSFYGFLYYPLTALPATVLGADVTVRLLAVLSLVATFEAWRRVARRLAGNPMLAVLGGLAVAAHPYVFTNLYNRSALTEYFGMEWMALALALVVRWLGQSRWGAPAPGWMIFTAFLLVALVGGTHPPTLYLSALVLLPVLGVAGYLFRWRPARGQLYWAAAGALFLAVLLFRWSADSLRWGGEFAATNEPLSIGSPFDDWLQRLSLLPFDPQTWHRGWIVHMKWTPFLESPLNWLLWLGAVVGAIRLRRQGGSRLAWWLVVAVLGYIALFTVASFSPSVGTGLPWVAAWSRRLLQPVQFGYRLVGTLQTGLVLALLLVAELRDRVVGEGTTQPELRSRAETGLLRGSLAIGVVGVAMKVGVLFAVYPELQRTWIQPSIDDYPRTTDGAGTFPHFFYGLSGYLVVGPSAPAKVGQSSSRLVFLKRNPTLPWRTYDVPLNLPAGTDVWVAALVNPATRVVVDGRVLETAELRTFDRCFVVRVPQPGAMLRVEVDRERHRWLNALPWIWLGGALGAVGGAWLHYRRRAPAAPLV